MYSYKAFKELYSIDKTFLSNEIKVTILNNLLLSIIQKDYLLNSDKLRLETYICYLLGLLNLEDLYNYISEDFIDGLNIDNEIIVNNELIYLSNNIANILLFDALKSIYVLCNSYDNSSLILIEALLHKIALNKNLFLCNDESINYLITELKEYSIKYKKVE